MLPTWSHTSRTAGQTAPAEPRSIAPHDITPRQLECLAWVRQGKSATDIGIILGISGRTVESHLARVCEHLSVKTRLQAVLKAQAIGLISGSARRLTQLG
jgi:DNA-binding CsgD family transcriptional regulator